MRTGSIGLSQIRHGPFWEIFSRPNMGGSAQSRCVVHQICGVELTVGQTPTHPSIGNEKNAM